MANKLPGQQGIQVMSVSSMDKRVIGKFQDTNHLDSLRSNEPAEYDKKLISLYTQTGYYANDFLNMITGSTPYTINSNTDSWTWKVGVGYQFNKLIAIPALPASPGIDESSFQLVFERPSFQINDIIIADKRHGDALLIASDPKPFGTGALYEVKLTGAHVTNTSVAQSRYLQVGQTYEKIDNIVGEFDRELTGLDAPGETINLVESLSAGWGIEDTITKWADQRTLRDAQGRPLDLQVYANYRMNEAGKREILGVRWEPFVEAEMRKEMLRLKTERWIWGKGGQSQTKTGKQEVRKHVEGIYSKIKNSSNYVPFNRGSFSLNLLRDTFGDLFYRRVDMKDRKVKLFTNEAGIALFRQANKDDLMATGLNLILDIKDYNANNKITQVGFDMMFSMETGTVEVSHLRELDMPQNQADFQFNKRSAPIFFVFDLTNPNGGLQNIREVRQAGAPAMTWGYVDGRQHHLGFAASQGMNSASKDPGYTIWMEDRSDLFVEDLSRMVVLEETQEF